MGMLHLFSMSYVLTMWFSNWRLWEAPSSPRGVRVYLLVSAWVSLQHVECFGLLACLYNWGDLI